MVRMDVFILTPRSQMAIRSVNISCLSEWPAKLSPKFWFFPPRGGDPHHNTQQFHCDYVRWKFDPNATDFNVKPEVLVALEGEMPRVDDRYVTKPYSILFLAMTNKTVGRDKAVTGGSYNSIARCDVSTGEYKSWCAGAEVTVHEAAFVPRSENAPEGDGWLITVANRRDIKQTCLLILDSVRIEDGPVAIIELPFRLRAGIHGSWVPASALSERRELCDMHGVTPEIVDRFAGTRVQTPFKSNAAMRNGGVNGVANGVRNGI